MSVQKVINRFLNGSTYSEDGYITTSYADDYVVRKQAMSIRQAIAVPAAETTYILFDPTSSEHDIYLTPFRVATTSGPVTMGITTDFTYSVAENSYPVFNRYGLNVVTSTSLKNYYSITDVVIASTSISYVVGSSATNQSSGGGSTAGSSIYAFENDKEYLFSFTNNSGEAISISLQFDWFEETPILT